MKNLRRSILVFMVTIAMAACGPSLMGPHNPDAGNHNPDAGNHNPDAGNHNPDAGNHNPDAGN